MSKLKVPSLQHLARNWRDSPELIKKTLLNLARNSPTFNYSRVFDAVTDLLVLRVPYEDVAASIQRIKREDIRRNFQEIVPLLRDHFEGIAPDFVQKVGPRYYPIGRGLMVPFEPPIIYGVGGQIYFPWFSFWRQNPLAAKQLSLFVTVVYEVLLQDPDLENATFEILDFSVPAPGATRELRVMDAREVPRLSQAEKNDMLSAFAEGFLRAEAELSGQTDKTAKHRQESREHIDLSQLSLFD